MSLQSQLFLLTLLLPSILSLSCLNSNGQQVEWWAYIKTPNSIYENSSYFAMYYDSTMNSTDFKFIPERIDQQGIQIIFQQLSLGNSLYNTIMATHSSEYELIAWNDGNPITDKTSSAPSAHSKGVIGMDKDNQTGFYMQHSLPKYPNITNDEIDPIIDDSELIYGQNIMCLSVTADTLEQMAANLLIIKANIYFTKGISFNYPNLQEFANKTYINTTASLNKNFSLIQGLQMKMFSKSGYFTSNFIFENQIVPALQTSLYCETWGRPYQNASCDVSQSDFFVEEVLYLNFSQPGVTWKSTKDHSKWTISASSNDSWVCFGDINKMSSQSKRGGSYFCMVNYQLWNILSNSISSTQSCNDEYVIIDYENEIMEEDEEENEIVERDSIDAEKVSIQKLISDAAQRKFHNGN